MDGSHPSSAHFVTRITAKELRRTLEVADPERALKASAIDDEEQELHAVMALSLESSKSEPQEETEALNQSQCHRQ